jgi:hypothetical protein
MTDQGTRPRWAIALAIFAAIFGLLTLKSGGEVLFIDGAGRESAGNYVPFVLWFNFLAGLAYIACAVGLLLWRSWTTSLAFAIAILTILMSLAFAIHILMGGAYEARTVGAMAFRSVIWLAIAYSLRWKADFDSGLRE